MASKHDVLCPSFVTTEGATSKHGRDACWCAFIDMVRDNDQARIAAACRMLLDSGDITPMGVRILTMERER